VAVASRQGTRDRACPMRRLPLATLLLLVLLLVPAGAAIAADRPRDLLVDACRDERVDGTYSQRTYRRALDQLPADSDQYTGCRDVINRARLAALSRRGGEGGGGSTGSGGGSTGGGGNTPGGGGSRSGGDGSAAPSAPSGAERRAVENATRAGAAPVRVGGELLAPGAVRQVADDGRVLPTPLIALLAALAVCALGAAAAATWSRVHARRLG
jgi:hypothetical protein